MRLNGLTAATHTPFHPTGSLNLDAVERQALHLSRTGVPTAFICGTTGESHSLTLQERLDLAERWGEVIRGSTLRLVVHVGANCLADSRILAAQAEKIGAHAIAAVAPSYFRPASVEMLVRCCAEIANAAPGLPFYYYDIPSITGVRLSPRALLEAAAEHVPTLAGVKFSNPDLVEYQRCLQIARYDVPWGIDECLLAAIALGATGAVGSTYNFAAQLYRRLWSAYERGDMGEARVEQSRSVELTRLLDSYGYMPAAKAVMGFLGVDVGPARLPHGSLTPEARERLRSELEEIGYFEWGA